VIEILPYSKKPHNPRQLLRVLGPLVARMAEDRDAEEMAANLQFNNPFFYELESGIRERSIDSIAHSVAAYSSGISYSSARQLVLERIASASDDFVHTAASAGRFYAPYTDAIHRVVYEFIGDPRLDRWIAAVFLRHLLQQSGVTRAGGRQAMRRIQDLERVAMTGKVLVDASGENVPDVPGGDPQSIAAYAFRLSVWPVSAAAQNASVWILNYSSGSIDFREKNLLILLRRAILTMP
jgi:hypothetical protein